MQNKRRTAQNSAEQRRTREEHAILGPGEQFSSKGVSGPLKAPKNMTTKHKKHQFHDFTFWKNTPPRPSAKNATMDDYVRAYGHLSDPDALVFGSLTVEVFDRRILPPGVVAQPGHYTHTRQCLRGIFQYRQPVSDLHTWIMSSFTFPAGQVSVYWLQSGEREFNFSQPDQMISVTGLSPTSCRLVLHDSVSLRRRRTYFKLRRRRRQKVTSILKGWSINTLLSQ